MRVVGCRTEMLFVYRGIVYGELSAPIGGNVSQLKEVATFETSLVLTDNVNVKK